jgi:hypothetical protein
MKLKLYAHTESKSFKKFLLSSGKRGKWMDIYMIFEKVHVHTYISDFYKLYVITYNYNHNHNHNQTSSQTCKRNTSQPTKTKQNHPKSSKHPNIQNIQNIQTSKTIQNIQNNPKQSKTK